MVMFFNVEEARSHLLTHGHVFTLRNKRKREGIHQLRVGGIYKFKVLGKAYVSFVREITDPSQLNQYVEDSGFESIEAWLSRAKGDFPPYLHFVEMGTGPDILAVSLNKGWTEPDKARRMHRFKEEDNRSLCDRWYSEGPYLIIRMSDQEIEDILKDRSQRMWCRECLRKHKKERRDKRRRNVERNDPGLDKKKLANWKNAKKTGYLCPDCLKEGRLVLLWYSDDWVHSCGPVEQCKVCGFAAETAVLQWGGEAVEHLEKLEKGSVIADA